MQENESILSVRMLSVIARYGEFPSFAAFLSEWGEQEPKETERQISLHSATLKEKENGCLLTLTDEGCQTYVRWFHNKPSVTVLRRGEMQSEMHYEPSKITPYVYVTPFGALEGEIYTEQVQNTLSESGGALSLRYFTVIGGAYQRVTLKITVQ